MEAGFLSSVSVAFQDGGIWMWSILIVQIFTFAIIAERVLALFVFRKTGQKKLAQSFEADIKHGKLQEAQSRARAVGSWNAISQVAQAGAQAAIDLGGKDEIQARMDEVLLEERSRLEQRTGYLAMLGNVATLLGLLGTIVGLIQAFASVSGLDPVEKATLLTKGVALAMNTTAYGLIVAIPALTAYAILQSRTNNLVEDLHQGALKIYNWLIFRLETIAGGKTGRTTSAS